MPVGFCVLGYLLIYTVFTPIITPVLSVSEMFISDADFKNGENLTSIFDKNSAASENTGDTVDMSQVQIPSYGTHYANLSIDSVSIDAPLYFGDSSAALSQGVAQYNGSFLPGFGRPILISGHNNSYFNSLQYTQETEASSNFVIGLDGEIIQCVPTWEVAYASNERNMDTVSIECCHPDDSGAFTDETYRSLVQLTAWLCEKFDLTQDDVIRHYDVTGKICPKYFVDHEDEWTGFKANVGKAMERSAEEAE